MFMTRRSRLSRQTDRLARPLRKASRVARRNVGWTIAGVGLLAFAGLFIYFYPELHRYIHMKRM